MVVPIVKPQAPRVTRVGATAHASHWISLLTSRQHSHLKPIHRSRARTLEYWFHTPGSNELDVLFGHSENAMLDSGSVSGTLRPGALYRFELTNSGVAFSQGPFTPFGLSHSDGSSRLAFAVPESTPIASLLGVAICFSLRRPSGRVGNGGR
jgi:hypothetical protein